MEHDSQTSFGGQRENAVENDSVADDVGRRVVAGHEDLDAHCAAGSGVGQHLGIALVDPRVEPEVDQRAPRNQCGTIATAVQVAQWRAGVGHVDDGRDPAGGGGPACVLPVLFMREARGPEVNVGIDQTWEQVVAFGVDHASRRARLPEVQQLRDAPGSDRHAARRHALGGDESPIDDSEIGSIAGDVAVHRAGCPAGRMTKEGGRGARAAERERRVRAGRRPGDEGATRQRPRWPGTRSRLIRLT